MRSPQPGMPLYLLRIALVLLALLLSSACSSNTSPRSTQHTPPPQITPAASAMLPEQRIWKQGISSFIFGTNDTQEWYQNNVETNPAIQQALKGAHFTLMRTFFFSKSLVDNHATTDKEIEQRLKTIENSDMICLGVLADIFDVSFAKHVVSYASNRCNLYEFGNEPDTADIGITDYLKQWNTVIPLLRQINPKASFIGPAAGVGSYLKEFLTGVKQSGVLPDAVSFHWYPCWHDTQADCLSKANTVGPKVQTARTWVKELLGKDLPIGVTEWNFDPGNPPAPYGNDTNFMNSFTTDALETMMQVGVDFACQFAAASGTVYLDMFDFRTSKPKTQYYTIKMLIQRYRI
ncbi:GH39 family glycosyl hydrolase [Ktedonosporobacter rubrisoli]|uniref:GH39 family glycosyl hydrolase n=1 Tax=Ktedonosporobacter rubrisoli TaxID=2509675 RepID=UPI0013EEE544|nr:glycosyl hydrolase [Ktedonosporobacter rubrisoli]